MDESVKVWDIKGGEPKFVSNKNMSIGEVYAISSCPVIYFQNSKFGPPSFTYYLIQTVSFRTFHTYLQLVAVKKKITCMYGTREKTKKVKYLTKNQE